MKLKKPNSLLGVLQQTVPLPFVPTDKDEKAIEDNQEIIRMSKGDILMIDVSSIAYHLYYQQCATVVTSELSSLIPVLLFKRILHIAQLFKTGNVMILWDSKVSDRKTVLPTYKGQRETYKTEKEIARIAIMKKAIRRFRKNWAGELWPNVFVQKGKECDDLMAVFSRTLKLKHPRKLIIVANDGDLYQLLSDSVRVYALNMDTLISPADFREKYGYDCKYVTTQKSICGCASDNVKGIGGVAMGRFLKLLNGDGKILQDVIRYYPKVMQNLPLVSLPYKGTRVPRLRHFGMGMNAYRAFCNENGLSSFLAKEREYEKLFNR